MIEGDIGTWAPQVWDALIQKYNVKSVIDVGCGAGHSLRYFLNKGLRGIGVEGWTEAINRSPVKSHIVAHDYCHGPYVTSGKFDLCWSCEFVEHVDAQYVQNFMDTFKCCKVLAMTHAVPGQPGFHHVNCQPLEYWTNILANNGFKVDIPYSEIVRDLLPRDRSQGGHVANTLLIAENQLW